jgi:hypothetical protein
MSDLFLLFALPRIKPEEIESIMFVEPQQLYITTHKGLKFVASL